MVTSRVLKLSCIVLICMVVGASPHAEAAITCGAVVNSLTPCIPYVTTGGAVPANCCSGIKSLYGAAQTTADRQSVCRCLKSAASGISYTSYNLALAAGLPAKCGINIPYKISPSTDCNSVKLV
ncbi:hypothetical protein L1049_009054 [Liquidambar formosana]|uniref:Non-specific lipid-transfer protein n=1 Tax=Liquidambar formosana TaxID=63359 RepID=A0AAP0X4Z3_LIQFO